MRRLLVFASLAFALALGSPALVSAQAEESPVGGATAHPHHIHTPAGCKDINAVTFEIDDRGLHRGATESGTVHGPEHRSCQQHPE